MYITTKEALQHELEIRKANCSRIDALVDEFAKRHYGISDFSKLSVEEFALSLSTHGFAFDAGATYGVLARQVPGVCVEDIACALLAKQLDLTYCAYAFARDSFFHGSNDKLYRLKLPMIAWSKKGNMTIGHEFIFGGKHPQYENLNMMRLDRIVHQGVNVLEVHEQMQRGLMNGSGWVRADISRHWASVLAKLVMTGRLPESVWKDDGSGRDVRSDWYSRKEAEELLVRPTAKWYYGLYLALFLRGDRVLLETYDNEAGGVPEARKVFEAEMKRINAFTGYSPLVVKTTPLTCDMLYINRHIVSDGPVAMHELRKVVPNTDDTERLTRYFADVVIRYGKP